MKRREFLLALGGGALLPFAARAELNASMSRIAMYSAFEPLSSMYENSYNRYIRTLFAEMRRLGLVEGKSIKIERYGRETPDVTPTVANAAVGARKAAIIFCVAAGAVF